MKKLDSKGFGAVEAVLIVVVIGILGFVGYRAYEVYTDTETTNNNEQVSIKKTVDRDTKEEEPIDPISNWVVYTSQNGRYKLSIPDGWRLTSLKGSDDIIAWDAKDITYQTGTQARVTEVEGGRDGSTVAFYLIYDYKKHDKSYLSPDLKVDKTYTTDNGIKVKRSSRLQRIDPSMTAIAMGIPKGTKQYTYDLTHNGKNIHIVVDVQKDEKDQSELVEAMISSLEFN